MTERERLSVAKRIVVKVGTSTLTHGTGRLDYGAIERLVHEIADLESAGREMVLVTSGAVAAGCARIGTIEKPKTMQRKQALAAIGQGVLMHVYERLFADCGKIVAQVLLTRSNALEYSQYKNSRSALLELIEMGIIPVINENDAVAVEEFKIGDNDTLSAMVAALIDADALIILTDIDGVYTANPSEDANARLIDEITAITPEIEAMAGGAGSSFGTGGMTTKLEAAKMAHGAGVSMVIASGQRENVLRGVLAGAAIGTIFPAREAHLKVRKSWLAVGKSLAGELTVDDGCEQALRQGSSLLSAGIIAVAGDFAKGSAVRVLTLDGREIARGIVSVDAVTLVKLLGHRTADFAHLLAGENVPDEAIHRDNVVLLV